MAEEDVIARLLVIADNPILRTCEVCRHVNSLKRLWGWGTCGECGSIKGEEKAPPLPARSPDHPTATVNELRELAFSLSRFEEANRG